MYEEMLALHGDDVLLFLVLMRSIHSCAYAHKHIVCKSVRKSLRDAASVCKTSDAL